MIAIRIENLTKEFQVPLSLTQATSKEAWSVLMKLLGFSPNTSNHKVQKIKNSIARVLEDISLEVHKGSIVCVTGPSQGGKSVLLKIFAGMLTPTKGRIEIRGSMSSLTSIGDNIDKRLTGFENIKNYQRKTQMPKEHSERHAEQVIQFAELNGFEHLAVRTYSTGMQMRLSIALALLDEASLLLLDDVLGVGDIAFQQKCIDRLLVLKHSAKTLIFVSNDETLIQQLATHVIQLNNGRVEEFCSLSEREMKPGDTTLEWQVSRNLPENEIARLESITISEDKKTNDALILNLHFQTLVPELQCRPLIDVYQKSILLFRSVYAHTLNVKLPSSLRCQVEIPLHLLSPARYQITVSMLIQDENITYALKAAYAVSLTIGSNQDALLTQMMRVPFPCEVKTVGLPQ